MGKLMGYNSTAEFANTLVRGIEAGDSTIRSGVTIDPSIDPSKSLIKSTWQHLKEGKLCLSRALTLNQNDDHGRRSFAVVMVTMAPCRLAPV
jgi:hypothetical protein